MKPFKVLVVEDELVVAMHLCSQLEEFGYDVLPSLTNYNNAAESLNRDKPDIALLDIKLEGEKTGIDLACYITEHIHIPFIFLTSLTDRRTFEEAKILKPSAYLVKPFRRDDLFTSIELALFNFYDKIEPDNEPEQSGLIEKDAFIIQTNHLFSRVKFSEIAFAKSDHVYIELYTVDGSKHLIRSTVEGLLGKLPNSFCRTHRSFIINLNFVDSFSSQIVKVSGTDIPVGRSFACELKAKLDSNWPQISQIFTDKNLC
jgi:DNA-binding LytR/AlgR family response regulator